MLHFLHLLVLLILFSYNSSETFYKIYENEDTGEIRGIADDEPMLAIVTEKFVIFGNVDSSFLFTEKSKIELPKNLTGDKDLLEFKFISSETVIICNAKECCTCVNGYKCTTIVSFPIISVAAETVDKMLFLRVVHKKNNATIYSFKFENGKYQSIGASIDRTSDIHEFKAFYSFSYGPHTYFISQIKREDIILCLAAQNFTRINTDIVITQLCNNDQSDKMISKMDLRLSCKRDASDQTYGDFNEVGRETYQNNIKGVTFLRNLKQLFFSLQVSPHISYMCQFDMNEIVTEFCKTWNFCHHNSSAIPEKCQNAEHREESCFKFSTTNDYPFCKNSELYSKSECDAIAYAKTSDQTSFEKMEKWKESHTSSYGRIMPEDAYSNSYGPLFNSDKQFYITSNDMLTKTGNRISHYLKGLADSRNSKTLSIWDLKNGIMYVDPIAKNAVYLKEVVCTDHCLDELYSTNLICNLCDQKYSHICNYVETKVYCGPLWRKFFMIEGKNYDPKIILINYNGTKRRMECYPSKDNKKQQCNKILDEYLTPFFTATITPNKFIDIGYQLKISNSTLFILLIVAGTLAVLTAFIVCIYCIYKRQLIKKQKKRKPYMDALINSERLVILEKIGEGSSAVVNLGEYTNEGETKKVAVKTLNCCRADVIKEIEALSSCKHDNVIAFIGWMEIDDEMKIITEYLSGGDLHSYLTNPNKILKISTIFSYIFQVLDAMIFMSHKHIIHRDLSARNCLLDETFECLKISDFGLARLTNVDYEYLPETNRPLPFRWLPLEAFKGGNFSVKGDIWSIGVLIWELFERGACPYKNLFYPEVVEYLASGKRLVRPEQCPKQLYTVMSECWNENPINRPTFDAIKEDIKAVYSYLKLYEPEKLNMIIEVTGVEISSASN